MSIADKLQDLIDAKADMKSAIESKGVEVTGGLSTYADAIRDIEWDYRDVEVIYVPNGVNIGFKKPLGDIYIKLPKKIAFDITDNPDFAISISDYKYSLMRFNTNEKKIIVVVFE